MPTTYPMSYDPSTKVLTITNKIGMGDTEANAINFQQVKEYARYIDPSLASEDGYYFNFVIRISPTAGTNLKTYFADTNKSVYFTREGIQSLTGTIHCDPNTYFRLGEMVDEETKYTRNGCSIYIENNQYYADGLNTYGDCHIYSSYINVVSGGVQRAAISFGSPKVWNTTINNGSIYQTRGDFYNVTMTGDLTAGYGIFYSQPTFNDVKIQGYNDAIRIRNQSHNVFAENVTFSNNNTLLSCHQLPYDGANAILLDCIADNWEGNKPSFSNDSNVFLYRRNSIHIAITDEDNNPIDGAKVRIYNKDGLLFENITVCGELKNSNVVDVVEYRYKRVDGVMTLFKTDFNPFRIEIEADGYEGYCEMVNIYEKQDRNFALKKEVPLLISQDGVALKLNPKNMGNDRDMIINL